VEPIRIAIVTISDSVTAGTRTDTSGAAIASWAAREGRTLVAHEVVPDSTAVIAGTLLRLCDGGTADLVVTTGGTGFSATDVTPEATAAVIERAAPGIAEAIRARGAAGFPHALLARGVAGIRGATLIVNLPGSGGGVRDGLAVLDEVVAHAVQLLRGVNTQEHPHDG
jgi:molybdenum cofactor biosynthesis protein B